MMTKIRSENITSIRKNLILICAGALLEGIVDKVDHKMLAIAGF